MSLFLPSKLFYWSACAVEIRSAFSVCRPSRSLWKRILLAPARPDSLRVRFHYRAGLDADYVTVVSYRLEHHPSSLYTRALFFYWISFYFVLTFFSGSPLDLLELRFLWGYARVSLYRRTGWRRRVPALTSICWMGRHHRARPAHSLSQRVYWWHLEN